MEKKKYFQVPTQVRFWDYMVDDGEDHWLNGIAYRDEVICACCGGIFEIRDIYELAPENIEHPLMSWNSWVDFNEALDA